jgi:predicted dehydrogenase
MVNFTFRCRPEFQLAAEIIRAGTLGEVYQIWGSISQGRWFTASGRPSHERDDAAAWKYDFGGVLHDLAPHLIDLARWWLGDLQAVQAWTKQLRAKEAPTIASCGVNLAMQSGAAVQLLCSRLATGAKEQTLLEVNGAQGSLRFSGVGVELWTRDEPRWRRLMVPSDAPRPLERFARAIRRLPTEIPTFWDGYKTNEAIAAIERSAETGERVRLPLAVSAHASERESIHAVADGGSAFESTALLRKA